MTKRLLIDGAHEEEVRVAIADDDRLEKFEFEILSKTQIKGNIYLAKIIRVEPSLQAAFVDYGGGKHGFLSFSEIHPNYFQIPVSDKERLDSIIENEYIRIAEKRKENNVEPLSEEEKEAMIYKIKTQFYKKYTIQEVIRKRQVILVQVIKEERGNKGAALTTYISLAGRYCVFMPNTQRPCGVSKKISATAERKKIKEILSQFDIPQESCVVVRTAGVNRTKHELKKDYEYLHKIWKEILEQVIHSQAPCLINEEAGIVKRSIRDMYSKEISEIIIDGEKCYKIAKNFMKKILPSHAKKIKLYDDRSVPLFTKFDLNEQVNQIYSTRVNLPSGGYLVINTTEALVAIDVNSGRSIKERSIGDTALKTNLEAAVEVVRQTKLRDLGGLIVVDFIDMNNAHHDAIIEKTVKDAFKDDKARTQVSNISMFGLLEISRQRLRPNLMETHRISCPYCSGTGTIWSTESMIVQALRELERTCSATDVKEVKITFSPQTAVYLLNNKRSFITSIENSRNCKICVAIDYDMSLSDFSVEPVSYYHREEDEENDAVHISNVFSHEHSHKKNTIKLKTSKRVFKTADTQQPLKSNKKTQKKAFAKPTNAKPIKQVHSPEKTSSINSEVVIKNNESNNIEQNATKNQATKKKAKLPIKNVIKPKKEIKKENYAAEATENKQQAQEKTGLEKNAPSMVAVVANADNKQRSIDRKLQNIDNKQRSVDSKQQSADIKPQNTENKQQNTVANNEPAENKNLLDIVNNNINNKTLTQQANAIVNSSYDVFVPTNLNTNLNLDYINLLKNALCMKDQLEGNPGKFSGSDILKKVLAPESDIKNKKGWWNKLLKN